MSAAPLSPEAERKVVTALFCDLVGFTALSESADPEDVDRMLTSYFAMAQSAIEAFGGVVEKFIGDAVVGVFGVPAAHEDDPERAVRAGLRIAEDAESLTSLNGGPLQLRVGINTGETLVRLGVVPGSGERFLAGDAINTASRIQSVAPLMGVAVGHSTYDATRGVFHYADLPPATLKGKSEPVAVFHAVIPRARLGTDVTRVHDGPFVGREIDLALLTGVFDETLASSTVQLVTIVGEPGMGKSRLVTQLLAHVDSLPDLVTWRQGRCLPYGDAITFWALGEIVKAHAGILDGDTAELAAAKLDATLPESDARAWLRQSLLPLIGLETASAASRSELFFAWRQFLMYLAQANPTVLVIEDLHWADPALLSFLEHLASHVHDVPLLVVGTTRPELFDRRPDFAAGVPHVTTIRLGPLTSDETSQLVAALLDATHIPAELQGPLVERAGGNPLFAEEYVRLLQDQGLLERIEGVRRLKSDVDLPLPVNVHALLAARLDALSGDRKALLADAAVIGKVFWAGAVSAMSGRPEGDVIEAMDELSRREFVRPVSRTSMVGQVEYAFGHVLARDVAYQQLPRSARASRHVAAARWLEEWAGQRVDDVADVLAHHYIAALDLAEAAGDTALAADVRPEAARSLLLSGERASGLDANSGLGQLERALALITPDDGLRGRALAGYGRAALYTGHLAEGEQALEEAIHLFEPPADLASTIEALDVLAKLRRRLVDPRWIAAGDTMLSLVESSPPGPLHVRVYTHVAGREMILQHHEVAIRYADEAVSLAGSLGLEVPVEALGFRASARSNAEPDSPDWVRDFEEAIALGSAAGLGQEVAVMYGNYALASAAFRPVVDAAEVFRAGISYADARGLAESLGMQVEYLDLLVSRGELDDVVRRAEELAPQFHDGDVGLRRLDLLTLRLQHTRALVLLGEAATTTSWLDWMVATNRELGYEEVGGNAVGAAALAYAALGDEGTAVRLLSELADHADELPMSNDALYITSWIRALVRLRQTDLARRMAELVTGTDLRSQRLRVHIHATLEEASGNHELAITYYADAVARWHEFGDLLEESYALLGQARCLLTLARPREAVPLLERADHQFGLMGAKPVLADVRSLLTSASA